MLIKGAPNSDSLIEMMNSNDQYKAQFLNYTDSIICTYDPLDSNQTTNTDDTYLGNLFHKPLPTTKSNTFQSDFNLLMSYATKTFQLHKHCFSCYKIKSLTGCRFRKPDETFIETHWDEERE